MISKLIFKAIILSVFTILLGSNSFAVVNSIYNTDPPKPFILDGAVTIQLEDNVDVSSLKSAPYKARFSVPSLDALFDKNKINEAKAIFPFITEKPKINSGRTDLTRYYELHFSKDRDVYEVVKELQKDPNIRMAEPVWIVPMNAVPNDPLWGNQWAMIDAVKNPHFNDAWDYETGSDSIKIAIIDSGVLYHHQDLIDNIWVNPGEDLDGDGAVYDLDDMNGIDDDGNGYIDDVIGYDFLTSIGSVWPGEDGYTPDNDPKDFGGHGTHCSGIVAAANNNGLDLTGIAGGWFGGNLAFRGSKIIPCRAGATADDGRGYLNSNNIATAIAYATMMGAHVMNASWTGGSVSAAAANNAIAAGATFCHAAGNDDELNTPDALDNVSGVLSVASSFSNDGKSTFSNYGYYVDVTAPGEHIFSTMSNEYLPALTFMSGTSMAAPMVCGLAALIRSAMPSLSRNQVDSIIIHSAESENFYTINAAYPFYLGSGRIDALAALSSLANAKFTADIEQGQAPLTVQFSDLSPNSPVAWDWSFGTGAVSTEQNPSYTYNDVGVYSVSLIEDENHHLGFGEEHLKNYIWVTDDTLIVDNVTGYRNSETLVPIYVHNTALIKEIRFTFTYANTMNVRLIDVSVDGLRTDHFESQRITISQLSSKKASVTIKSDISVAESNYLIPGGGNVFYLHFSSDDIDGVIDIDTITITGSTVYTSGITTIYGDYFPASFTAGSLTIEGIRPVEFETIGPKEIDENSLLSFDILATSGSPDITLTTSTLPPGATFVDNGDGSGQFNWTPNFLQNGDYEVTFYADDGIVTDSEIITITVVDLPCCVNIRGNINGDVGDVLDIDDLIYLVDFQFNDGDPTICPDEADLTADQTIDIDDLIFMVEFQFNDGPTPGPCP